MKAFVCPANPVNRVDPSLVFDEMSYLPFRPKIIRSNGWTLVTRIGLTFASYFIQREVFYKSKYVILKCLFIGLASIFRRGVVRVEEDGAVFIHSPWTAGYYHWLTESIPRALVAYESNRGAKFWLPERGAYSKYSQTLELLGIKNVDYFPQGRNVLVKSPMLTTCPTHFGTTAPDVLVKMREIYWGALKIKNAVPKERIYVSRKQARGRRVVNEEDVISVLQKFNFRVIAFEDYSFADQVELMSATELLVSIHGAGLTNMIFMPSGGKILELIPKKNGIFDFNLVRMSTKHDSCYLRLASVFDHDYAFQQCLPECSMFESTHMANVHVDVDELEANIRLLLDLDINV